MFDNVQLDSDFVHTLYLSLQGFRHFCDVKHFVRYWLVLLRLRQSFRIRSISRISPIDHRQCTPQCSSNSRIIVSLQRWREDVDGLTANWSGRCWSCQIRLSSSLHCVIVNLKPMDRDAAMGLTASSPLSVPSCNWTAVSIAQEPGCLFPIHGP